MILTLTIQEDAAILSLFFKAAVYFTINIPIWTTLALSGQLPAFRMFDIHVTFVHFKFYLWTFQEVPKTTPISKLAAKAATVPETPVRDSKPSPKKTVTPKKDKKMLIRKLQSKEHQRCQNQRKWLKFHPHWKRKRSDYRSFMARDGPRTLGSKEIPQVGFKVQDLIINSPL